MDMDDGLVAKRSTAVPGLPDDVLVEILSRVPARSIHQFKCVSKPWRDLIADPLNRKRLPQTLEGFFFSDGAGAGDGFRGCFASLPGRSAPLVDPTFSFLTKLPGIENIKLLGSCNGLLLFEHGWNRTPAYGVCNPATEEWVSVPSTGCPSADSVESRTDLIFDPAVSPHFHLVQIWQEDFLGDIEVRAFSSETSVWSERAIQQSRWQEDGWKQWAYGGPVMRSRVGTAFVNGMLHLVVFSLLDNEKYMIAAVDVEGKTCRIIPWPDNRISPLFLGQSQGRLHCVGLSKSEKSSLYGGGLVVWVLEGYDTKEWVLKHRVSFLKLFGCLYNHDSAVFANHPDVFAIHPDRNLIFIHQYSNQKHPHCNLISTRQGPYNNQKLISYDMDSKQLHVFHTLGDNYGSLTPYVPNFLKLVLTNEH